jgi:O-antigen/teichoic acid export membrane protein
LSRSEITNIKTRIVRSAIWTTNSKIIAQGAGFISTLVLARLLNRSEFGLMAMALSFMGLIDTFIDFGFLSAIIQAKEITQRHLSSCFWILTLFSLILSICAFSLASYIGYFYDEPRIVDIIKYLVPILLFSPFNIVCKGVLSRDIRLDTVAKIELYSGVAKIIFTISLAYLGLGVFSLVIGYILEKVLHTILCGINSKWYPNIEYNNICVRSFFNFGVKSTLSSLLWFVMTKTDVFVIGRILGAEVLGVYTIASQFPQTIARLVPIVWMRIAYPLFSKFQQKPELNNIVTRSSYLLNVICFPLFLGIASIAPDLINMFFGQHWREAILPLQILSLVAAIEAAVGVLPSALNAIGRPGSNTIINFVVVIVYPFILYFAGERWQISGILWGMVIIQLLRYVIFVLVSCYLIKIDFYKYIIDQLFCLLCAVFMFIIVKFLSYKLLNLNIYFKSLICIFIGAVLYSSFMLIFNRKSILESFTFLNNL